MASLSSRLVLSSTRSSGLSVIGARAPGLPSPDARAVSGGLARSSAHAENLADAGPDQHPAGRDRDLGVVAPDCSAGSAVEDLAGGRLGALDRKHLGARLSRL